MKNKKRTYCRAVEHVEVSLDDVIRAFIKKGGIRFRRAEITQAESFIDIRKGVVLFRCFIEPKK